MKRSVGHHRCRRHSLDIPIDFGQIVRPTAPRCPSLSTPSVAFQSQSRTGHRDPTSAIPDWPSASQIKSPDKPPDPVTETLTREDQVRFSLTAAPAHKPMPAQISASVRRLYIAEANLRLCIGDGGSVWVHSGRAVLAQVGSGYHPPTFEHPHNHHRPVAVDSGFLHPRAPFRTGKANVEMIVVAIPRAHFAQPRFVAFFISAHFHFGPREHKNPLCAFVFGCGLDDFVVGAGPTAVGEGPF